MLLAPLQRFLLLYHSGQQITILPFSIPLLSNQDAGGFLESDCIEKAPFLWEKKAVRIASQTASIAVSCVEYYRLYQGLFPI
jgi:hypothetical protein